MLLLYNLIQKKGKFFCIYFQNKFIFFYDFCRFNTKILTLYYHVHAVYHISIHIYWDREIETFILHCFVILFFLLSQKWEGRSAITKCIESSWQGTYSIAIVIYPRVEHEAQILPCGTACAFRTLPYFYARSFSSGENDVYINFCL